MSGHPRRRPRILLPDLRKNHCGAPDRLLIGPGVRKRALDPLEALDIRPRRLKFALPHNRHLKITHILPLTRARTAILIRVFSAFSGPESQRVRSPRCTVNGISQYSRRYEPADHGIMRMAAGS